MTKVKLLIILLGLGAIYSCQDQTDSQMNKEEAWKLGWRLIESSMDENWSVAELQFDTLRKKSNNLERKFLTAGLEVKSKLNKEKEILEILNLQNDNMLRELCTSNELKELSPCHKFAEEKIENRTLQLELIKMYVDDQAARGNFMDDIISKYGIAKDEITINGPVGVDKKNQTRLKEIFKEYGFPNRKLVGKDAMYGIFLILQHSDMDKEWQKSQLPNIESAVKNGDLDGPSYAYLYDRIKINEGAKQLYGSQFANVDFDTKTVELAATEDLDNLDNRRREMGMMPIEMYKRLVLKSR